MVSLTNKVSEKTHPSDVRVALNTYWILSNGGTPKGGNLGLKDGLKMLLSDKLTDGAQL